MWIYSPSRSGTPAELTRCVYYVSFLFFFEVYTLQRSRGYFFSSFPTICWRTCCFMFPDNTAQLKYVQERKFTCIVLHALKYTKPDENRDFIWYIVLYCIFMVYYTVYLAQCCRLSENAQKAICIDWSSNDFFPINELSLTDRSDKFSIIYDINQTTFLLIEPMENWGKLSRFPFHRVQKLLYLLIPCGARFI